VCLARLASRTALSYPPRLHVGVVTYVMQPVNQRWITYVRVFMRQHLSRRAPRLANSNRMNRGRDIIPIPYHTVMGCISPSRSSRIVVSLPLTFTPLRAGGMGRMDAIPALQGKKHYNRPEENRGLDGRGLRIGVRAGCPLRKYHGSGHFPPGVLGSRAESSPCPMEGTPGPRIGIVSTRWNEEVVGRLLQRPPGLRS